MAEDMSASAVEAEAPVTDIGLTCGVCQTDKGVDAICHHCSLPLCPDDRIAWRDKAFHQKPVAIHCLDCLLNYHIPAGSYPLLSTTFRFLWTNVSTFRTLVNRQRQDDEGKQTKTKEDELEEPASG